MECCFCGERIERNQGPGVKIVITSLWERHNPALQDMQAHARCMAAKLSRDFFFDEDFEVFVKYIHEQAQGRAAELILNGDGDRV